MTTGVFLTAEWRSLLMLNFACPPAALQPFVPQGTQLDHWHGQSLVSLVGFRFLKTCVCGWSIPGHRDFDEVNLRFYVFRDTPTGPRRGVVFIKEIVPRTAIAWVARTLYGENYVRFPMRSRQQFPIGNHAGDLSYEWRVGRDWLGLHATITGEPTSLMPNSEAEFITEHYWGYARQRNGSTLEYEVEHPRWQVWPATSAEFRGPAERIYPPAFAAVLTQQPVSAFVADGSPIVVRRGIPLTTHQVPGRSQSCTLTGPPSHITTPGTSSAT